ncbi:MAG: pyrroline-5-carboxylate reductase [Natronospirillum sp.]
MQHSSRIAFIGVGNMAGAIAAGMIKNGFARDDVLGTTRSADSARHATETYGIAVGTDNAAAISQADVVVLAVKPQMMYDTCQTLKAAIQARNPLVVSVAAGIRAEDLDRWLGGDLAVVRCMPNTPSMLGAGMSGLYANDRTTKAQKTLCTRIFNAVGSTVWVDREEDMHTVTAISGSGPAYFYRFVEALMKAGQARGLSEQQAHQLATCTALGAARMMTETEDSPALLRQKVCSPKGTTEQAIMTFDREGLDTLVDHAVQACFGRSEELARELANTDT